MQENNQNKKNLQSLALSEDTWLYLQHLDSVYILDPSFEQDDFELTTYSSASQSQGNTINETSTGGLLAGGVALETAVYKVIFTGGLLASGVGLDTVVYNISATGGPLVSGVGLESFSDVVEVSGGSIAGGLGFVAGTSLSPKKRPWLYRYLNLDYIEDSKRQTIEFANFKSLKNKANKLWLYRILKLPYIDNYVRSTIDFAFFYRPAGDEEIYNETMSGGCSASGSLEISEGIVGLGGVDCNGSSSVNANYFTIIVDGYFVGGGKSSDTLFNDIVASGGCFCGGVSDIGFLYQQISTGGLLAGGFGTDEIINNIVSTGGSLVGGVSLKTFNDIIEVSGGSIVGGSGSESLTYNIVPIGGVLGKGFSFYFAVFNPTLLKIVGEDDSLIVYQILKLEYVYDSAKIYVKYPQDIIRSSGGLKLGGLAHIPGSVDVSVGGGSLAGGFALQVFNDVIETSGGSLVGGVASAGVQYSDIATGGSLTGGVAGTGFLYEQLPTGGLLAGGSSSDEIFYNIVSTGGTLAGGVGLTSVFYKKIATGGSLVGGVASAGVQYSDIATGGSLTGGVAGTGFLYEQLPTGGLLAGGSSSDEIFYNIVSTGGTLAGGVGLTSVFYKKIATGGSLVGGSSISGYFYQEPTFGGSLAGGSSAAGFLYEQLPTVGLLAGGFFAINSIYNTKSVGGLSVDGLALQTFNDIFEPSGGVFVDGTSKQTLSDIVEVSGGLKINGSAVEQVVFLVSGGAVCGGLTEVLPLKDFVPFGGIKCGGVSNINVEYSIVFLGGCLVKPKFVVSSILIEFLSGGIQVSGISLVSINFITFGGIKCNGSIDILALQDFVPFGGIKCGSSANFEILYNNESNSKIIVSGSSLLQHLKIPGVSGGVKVSGAFNVSTEISVGGGVFVDGLFEVKTRLVFAIRGGSFVSGSSSAFVYYNHLSFASILISGFSPVGSEVSVGGGIEIAGFADLPSFGFVSFGGIKTSGGSNNNTEFFIDSFGGVVCSGTSALGREFFEISKPIVFVSGDSSVLNYLPFYGGLVVSGVSGQTIKVTQSALGGVKCSGVSSIFVFYKIDLQSSGIKIGGESLFFTTIISDGGISLNGQLDLLPLRDFVPFGGVLTSGIFVTNATYTINSFGGLRIGGESNIQKPQSEIASGGAKVSGVSFVELFTTQTTSGGCIVGGSGFVEVIEKYTYFTEGGVVANGSSTIFDFTKANNLRFGKSTFGDLVYLHADLESLFLWNRPLSDAELQSFYLNSRKIFDNFNDEYFLLFFDQNFDIQTQGGIQLSGTALVSQAAEIGGGSKAGGEFEVSVSIVFAPSGGLSIPLTSADVNKQNNISSTGGVKTSGLADLIDISSGGLVCSGSILLRVIANIFPTGFAKVSGSASDLCTFDVVGKNGIVANGKAINFATYDLKVSGGSTVSGNSAFGISKDITSIIDLIASGSADLRTIFGPRATSGSRCSGSAVVDAQYNLDLSPSGGRLGGTSRIFVAREELFNGGCLLSGSINLLKETNLISKISINLGGLSPITCNYNIDSLSGCVVGGFGFVYANYSIISKQSITASGLGNSFVRNNVFSQIKLTCGGFALDEMDKIYFMEGGLKSFGNAKVLVYYNVESLGGILNSGRSIISLIVSKTSFVEVFVSGMSLNIFINSTSGGINLSGSSMLVDQRVYSYIVSTKRQNRLLLGSDSEFDENNYYYEQPSGGCEASGQSTVLYISGARGVTLGGNSQPVENRLYSYIVSTKRQNRLLLGSNSEFEENNYYHEQPAGRCKVGGIFVIAYISGARGVTLGGNSQPVENRLYSYIVSTKRQNRLLLGGNSEFDENNYYYEQPQGGVAIGINFVVVQASGARGVTLGGNSQPVENRLYSYIVSTKRQNRLLLGGNSEFDENNYYYEQPSGGCEASGQSTVLYVSGARGITLGGTSQPVTNKLHSYNSQGQVFISGFVSSKRSSYRNEFLGHFRLSGFADCRLVCQKIVCDDVGLKCKTKPPCESIVCDYSKEYFANCKYNKQNIRRCKTTSALLPAISNCRQKGYLPVKNRTRKIKERVTL